MRRNGWVGGLAGCGSGEAGCAFSWSCVAPRAAAGRRGRDAKAFLLILKVGRLASAGELWRGGARVERAHPANLR